MMRRLLLMRALPMLEQELVRWPPSFTMIKKDKRKE
jgi:hypothetical protein